MRYESIPERIKKYIKIDEETGCWIWSGKRSIKGHPRQISIVGEKWAPAKFLQMFLFSPVNPDHEASHICPNKACCRPHPEHVIFETHNANMARTRISNTKKCRKGHDMDEHNTCIKGGIVRCRICYSAASRARQKIRREKNKKAMIDLKMNSIGLD